MAPRTTKPESSAVIDLRPHDDLASLRHRLAQVGNGRVALRLPWDLRFLSRELDFDLLRREARRRQLQVAIVSADPERRQLARGCGFPTFATVGAAESADRWNGGRRRAAEPPPTYWWEDEPDLLRRRASALTVWLEGAWAGFVAGAFPGLAEWALPGLVERIWSQLVQWVKNGVRFLAFLLVVIALAGSAYVVLPTAEIVLVPAGETVTVSVPVWVDPGIGSVVHAEDGIGAVIPSRRVGLEVEGYAEVSTTETTAVAAGRATGEVLFTSRLAQDYLVPAGTVVRTSSTSYPIRFRTTADVVVAADGQAFAPIAALDDRTGNVGAFQINRVEGVAASAVRVTNPEPTTGAEATDVSVVVQADYDRVREQLTGELLDQAYTELHGLLEAHEFLPYESLRVEAVPKKAYSHFVGEEAATVGLNMRLLVSGQAVNTDDARGVARAAMITGLPPGYQLVDASFDVGDVIADEDGPGWFGIYVSGQGYGAASISEDQVVAEVRGMRIDDARAQLQQRLPLAEAPQFVIWPTWPERLPWLERVPMVPLRIDVHVTPGHGTTGEAAVGP